MAYFVKKGKAITTRRGVVAWDDEKPEITADDIRATDESDESVSARLTEFVEIGVLEEGEQSTALREAEAEKEANTETVKEKVRKAKAARKGRAKRKNEKTIGEEEPEVSNPSSDAQDATAGGSSRERTVKVPGGAERAGEE